AARRAARAVATPRRGVPGAADMRWIDRVERAWMARRRGAAAPGTRAVAAGGAIFRVRVVGRGGPTNVLAPDPPNVIEHLAAVAEALAVRHRVVCLELPGFGFSVAPTDFDFSVAANSRLIGALLDELDLGPYALALPCLAGAIGAVL